MSNAKKASDLAMEDLATRFSFPLPTICPAPHRAFIKTFTAEEVKMKSGLVIPGMSQAKDHNKNAFTLERKRYFIAALGQDFRVFDKDGKQVEVGDEVFMISYDDKSVLVLPEIQDDRNDLYTYHIIDDLAVVGLRRNSKPKE